MAKRKKPSEPPRDFLDRDRNSEIDDRAGAILNYRLPSGWIKNPMYKDYGRDYHIELTEPITWKKKKTKRVTGKAFYVQQKGTEKVDIKSGAKTIPFQLELRHIKHWVEECTLPVFLVVVDVTTEKIYWLFAQEYLIQYQGWKDHAKFTVQIPIENQFEKQATADFKKFETAIDDAYSYMKTIRGGTPRERAKLEVARLQGIDKRFDVQASITEQSECYTFIAREPITITLIPASDNPSTLKKIEDLINKGSLVSFDRGEIKFDGTDLLAHFHESGGAIQAGIDIAATVSLYCLNEKNEVIGKWEELPGRIEGGMKELWFRSNLPNSPIRVEVGPMMPDDPGGINFSFRPEVWMNKPVLLASWFDKTYELCRGVVSQHRMQIKGFREGNCFFGITAEETKVKEMDLFLELFELIRKARRIADKFGISPICKPDMFKEKRKRRNIHLFHDALFLDEGFIDEKAEGSLGATMPQCEIRRLIECTKELADVAMIYQPPADGVDIMGSRITITDTLIVSMTNAVMQPAKAELTELLNQGKEHIDVRFFCSESTRHTVRKASPSDIQRFEELPGGNVEAASENRSGQER